MNLPWDQIQFCFPLSEDPHTVPLCDSSPVWDHRALQHPFQIHIIFLSMRAPNPGYTDTVPPTLPSAKPQSWSSLMSTAGCFPSLSNPTFGDTALLPNPFPDCPVEGEEQLPDGQGVCRATRERNSESQRKKHRWE